MSVNYWWILCYLDPKAENELRSIYKSDYQKAIQENNKARSILKKWREDPDFLRDYHDSNYNDNLNEFIQAFTDTNFEALKKEVSPYLNEANCFNLNEAKADRIPGFMGNIFLGKNEVEAALKTVTEIFDRVDREKFYERICSVYVGVGSSEEIETDIENILTTKRDRTEKCQRKTVRFFSFILESLRKI